MWEGAGVWTWHRAERREQMRRFSSRESTLHSSNTHPYQRRDEQRDAPQSVLQLPSRLSARPAIPHAYRKQHTPPATLTPPASRPRSSRVDIQHCSSRWHSKHLPERFPPSLITAISRCD